MSSPAPGNAAADRNLLFGVLALQADLLNANRFVEACSAWAARKDTPLADLLVERGWLTPEDRADVNKLLERKLAKHGGDIRASLAEVASDSVRQTLATVADPVVHQTLSAVVAADGVGDKTTINYQPSGRERYTLTRLHASGGIGQVWLARDGDLGREVALKELLAGGAGNPAAAARFIAEAQITGQLQHPNIVPVYELVRPAGTIASPFYTMRFVRGRTLGSAIKQYHEKRRANEAGALAMRELLGHFVAVCNAVAYAHSRGVLHRDLKPGNVVLGDFGEVILLDWGLAKLKGAPEAETSLPPVSVHKDSSRSETVQGQVLGTPSYMPPEQAEGRPELVDERSDVYGLGAILYVILTGEPPFDGLDTPNVLRQVVADEPPPPRRRVTQTPRPLEAICLKALAKRPGQRYTSAKELAHDVERWLGDEPVSVFREPVAVKAGRWVKRHRVLTTSVAAAGMMAVVGLAGVLSVQRRANADLATKNLELAAEQAKVQARFELAQKAIATFHTGVSEDALLRNVRFQELRTKLLKEAAGFYGDLEKLLAGQTDEKSRKLLAAGYFQLGELTKKIGSQSEALAVHQKALAVRRELAAAQGMEALLDVARSLQAVGRLLSDTGEPAKALAAFEEQRNLAAATQAEFLTDEARVVLAESHHNIAIVLANTGKPEEALSAYEKAAAILQNLADANPGVADYQGRLAGTYNNIGNLLSKTGKPEESLAAYEKAIAIRQKLADAKPAISDYQSDLARSHVGLGWLLWTRGKLAESRTAYEKARAILQKLCDANFAVTDYQASLAVCHHYLGITLFDMGQLEEALAAHERAMVIQQKLADANPAVARHQIDLAASHVEIGSVLSKTGKPDRALLAYDKARAIQEKLAEGNPAVTDYQSELAVTHMCIILLLLNTEKPAQALQSCDKALAILRKLADASPSVTKLQSDLAWSQRFRGIALQKLGRPADAAAAWRESIAVLEKLAKPQPGELYNLACSYALLHGLAREARSGLTTKETESAGEQAMAALRRAVAEGYRNVADMRKDNDLDSLRKRPDFEKLLADLEAKEQKATK